MRNENTNLVGRAGECAGVERLLAAGRAGQSGVLVVRGEQGIGKTALLDHAVRGAEGYRVIRVSGVAAETALPYAGLQLLCSPLHDVLGDLPPPQRDAFGTAVGLRTGSAPDRLLVGVATLALLSGAATTRPLLCVVDDAQWLDQSSAQVLAFVARRLTARPIVLLFAERTPRSTELAGLPELTLAGLSGADARALFGAAFPGRVDEAVVDRIVLETRGNPCSLLELLRGACPARLAGGFGVEPWPDPAGQPLPAGVADLPADSRSLLLVAAADPVGDPALHWRGAAGLGVPLAAAEPLESAGLLTLGARITFRDPALRSAVYGAASPRERREVHRALAAATDPVAAPDRRAWHLAHAAEGPDEETAGELTGRAAIARDRGGPVAAAAFLERAALLTPDPGVRVERALTAAAALLTAGAPAAAERLLVTAEPGPLDEPRLARAALLRARIALLVRRGDDAPELLLAAARRLEPVEAALVRRTYLEALAAAVLAGRACRGGSAAEVAMRAWPGVPAPRAACTEDLVLDGLLVRLSKGYAAAAGLLEMALHALRDAAPGRPAPGDEVAGWPWVVCGIAVELWDADGWHTLSDRAVRRARDESALAVLPAALTCRAIVDVHRGDLAAAAARADEAAAVSAVTGSPPFAHASLLVAAWRGREEVASALIGQVRRDGHDRGEGSVLTTADLATAVLYNGLGRYDEALSAARDAADHDDLGLLGWVLVEMVEAAVRAGEPDAAVLAFQRLSERTRTSGSELALGVEARSRALLDAGPAAEEHYLEAIERLGRCRLPVHRARAQLVYGEWLRRKGRRIDARVPLRAARDLFTTMGAEAFAERAHCEQLATGERVRSRVVETSGRLTPQEARIACLARDGLTNPEIGARLFVSRRTVEYHLHKVFAKLGITSRTELHLVLSRAPSAAEEQG